MLSTLFKGIGGLTGDLVEGVKYVGSEIIDAPGAFIEGVQEGLITREDEPREADAVTPAKTTERVEPVTVADQVVEEIVDSRDEEIAKLRAQLKEANARIVNDPFADK